MAAPIVYQWDDGNAPVARGQRRSLCDILHACLVTGYGTKPGAGWTREYVNATFDKAVFRNNPVTGTGFYLQVDGLILPSANQSAIQGFEVMTSVNDGLFPFLTSALPASSSNTTDATARPWVLIADDRAFYFFCWINTTSTPSNAQSPYGMFFGDCVPRSVSDTFFCGLNLVVAYAHIGFAYLTTASQTATGSNYGIVTPRAASGVASSRTICANIQGGGPVVGCGAGGMAYASGDPIFISRPHIDNGAAYSFRGWQPGFYYPCHALAFNQLATIIGDDGSYLSVRGTTSGGSCNVFISLDDWWV